MIYVMPGYLAVPLALLVMITLVWIIIKLIRRII